MVKGFPSFSKITTGLLLCALCLAALPDRWLPHPSDAAQTAKPKPATKDSKQSQISKSAQSTKSAQAKQTAKIISKKPVKKKNLQRKPVKRKEPVILSVHTGKAKFMALTFDDGPEPVRTPALLNLLRKEQVKATFFVLGSQVAKYPHLARQIVNDGHLIANHTWSHRRFSKLNAKQIREELRQTNRIIQSVTGESNGYFRPPYGEMNDAQTRWIKRQGYLPVLWSVDPRDWDGNTVAQICNTVQRQIRPGGIVLLHTVNGSEKVENYTVEAVEVLISAYRKKGYTFLTIEELLKEKVTSRSRTGERADTPSPEKSA